MARTAVIGLLFYCDEEYSLLKYCTSSDYGYNGFTDGLIELLPEDDAATANWGIDWQMPSEAQYNELINKNNTITNWTIQDGVYGRIITSKSNGNSIFLPAAGYRARTSLFQAGAGGVGTYFVR